MKTTLHLLGRDKLTECQLADLWRIYGGNCHCSHSSFRQRAERFTHFALYLQRGEITGFTELRIDQALAAGHPHLLVHYGQTILPKGIASRILLPRTAAKLVRRFWWQMLCSKTWVWYDALSYKASTAAARRVDSLYPSVHGPTPASAKQLGERVRSLRFGKSFCPLTGTVLGKENVLRRSTSVSSASLLRTTELAFFSESETGIQEGFGQLTFTPIDLPNLSRLVASYCRSLWTGIKFKLRLIQLPGMATWD